MINDLKKLATNYNRVKPVEYVGVINFVIAGDSYYMSMEQEQVSMHEGKYANPLLTIIMSSDTYNKLLDGTWNGLTAAGRARMSEPAPLDFELPEGRGLTGELMQMLYHLSMHFFSGTYPTVAKFGKGHTRIVHGGNVTALAYGHGIRSAYYCITDRQQINSDERDPWWQCFSIIGGKGIATIDGQQVYLEKGVAIHVPPNVTHTFKAFEGELLELIWVAYGNKA